LELFHRFGSCIACFDSAELIRSLPHEASTLPYHGDGVIPLRNNTTFGKDAMPYNSFSYDVPDDLAACETLMQTLQEELEWLKNPHVIFIPKFDRLWVISETETLPATEAAKEAARAILRQRLQVTPGERVFTEDVYVEYLCELDGLGIDSRWLGRLVFEVFPETQKRQIRRQGRRANVYVGLAFRNPHDTGK
jgi:hypothetical protein